MGAGGGGLEGVIGGIVTCLTVVGCVPGIIAGGSAGGVMEARLRNFDYYFTIIGYDKSGRKLCSFNESKASCKMTQELTIISGLTEGKLRTYEQIKKLENRNQNTNDYIIKSENNSQLENLPQEINPI